MERSLYNLGTAVQNGDLTSAGSILTAFIQDNPQYAYSSTSTSSSSSSSQTQDPINQDFQTLANAISSNQVAAAQSAWTQIQSDLASNGITNLSDGKAATAELLAQTQASITQQIVSDALDASPIDSGTGLSSSLISSWLTYQDGGSATSLSSAGNTGSILDTSA